MTHQPKEPAGFVKARFDDYIVVRFGAFFRIYKLVESDGVEPVYDVYSPPGTVGVAFKSIKAAKEYITEMEATGV